MSDTYRMILVDDEDDVRGRILSKINPESGFEVVGKAGNGYDALELIEKYNPHVVLTDIKMPFINGIELARIIRRDYPTTKVAFISGYDEFDYAYKAIELKVVSYLMKPVTSEDIDVFLAKLKISLDQEFDFLSKSQLIHQKYNESIPMLINSYLSSYRFKGTLNKNDISHLEQYGINLSEGNYLVGMIGFDINADINTSEETKVFIGSLVEKVFENFTYNHHFLIPEGVVFLLKDPKMINESFIDAELYEIIKYADQYRQTTLDIGISKIMHEFYQYPMAYRESEKALRHSKYFNMGQIVYYKDIEEKEYKHILIDESALTEFESVLKYGEKEEIQENISNILNLAQQKGNEYILDPQLIIIKLANSLINFASSINVDVSDVIKGNIIEEMLKINDFKELQTYIYNAILSMREKNIKTQVDKTEKIVEEVYSYIEKNYTDSNISLETITSELNISVSYLSMLLKKQKGVTFNKELIKYRMEKAKELLRFSKEKIVNIAKMVGYNEVYYFSHSFKKYEGVSPKEFRTNA
jgi:two-component system response regulator YesN